MSKFFAFAILILLSLSCNKLESKKHDITKTWFINNVSHLGEDENIAWLGPGLTFNKNGSCELPIKIPFPGEVMNNEDGDWELIHKEGKYILNIKASNNYLNGVYDIELLSNRELIITNKEGLQISFFTPDLSIMN